MLSNDFVNWDSILRRQTHMPDTAEDIFPVEKPAKMRVLVAEDELVNRRIVEHALRKRGYDVVMAKDGDEAWQVLQNRSDIQLAVLDWVMPKCDGIEVCRMVRSQPLGRYVYTILLTSRDKKEDVARGLEAGADDYITKPFDITEFHARIKVGERMVLLQNQLKEHMEKLKELDRLKSEFLSTVSHEIRTPIAVMKGGVSLCLDGVAGAVTDMQKEILGDTLESIDRLMRLITDLLDVSKIEAGRICLHRRMTDLGVLAQKIRKNFLPQAMEKTIRLYVEIPSESPVCHVDPDKITQIFSNLVGNALRFTGQGGRVIIKVEDEGEFVHGSVSDNGVGIAEQDLPKLFSKFKQVGRVEGPGYKGTGLGLCIAKGLVEKHGGRIWVESKLGEGSIFHFSIRRGVAPGILLVGGEPEQAELVRDVMDDVGYRFIQAADGESVLEKAVKERPDLVVLDMNHSDFDAYELACSLKNHETVGEIPILLLAGSSFDTRRLGVEIGETPFPILEKPILRDELRRVVQEMITC
jgi:signal transduction histidine kinase